MNKFAEAVIEVNHNESLMNAIKEIAESKPFNIEEIKKNGHMMENAALYYKKNFKNIKRNICLLFGHKKEVEYKYYEDVNKDDFVTYMKCPRCGCKHLKEKK
jgi:hypothetical protein